MEFAEEIKILKQIFPKICSADTHQSRKEWNPNNPFQGHCAVITLLAQDILKGEILWASLEGTGWSGNHYWNCLPNGEEIDFSESQFGENRPNLKGEIRDRAFLLSSEDTKNKYQKLVKRYKEEEFKLQ
ncbi:MAG: hypothetical protein WC705_00425 [Candidatus Paceibacterota bacterium]|jgi:hypothetical protein